MKELDNASDWKIQRKHKKKEERKQKIMKKIGTWGRCDGVVAIKGLRPVASQGMQRRAGKS